MAYSIDKSIIFQKNARFACVCAFFVVPLQRIKNEIAISEIAITNLYTYDIL